MNKWIVTLLLVGNGLFSAETTELESGISLYKDKEYTKALEKLQLAFQEQPDDVDTNLYLGMTYTALGDYEASFMAFDRILIVNDDVTRAKLELARCCYELKLYDLSLQYFNAVLKLNVPKAVEDNIRLYIGRMNKSGEKHMFSGRLTLSAGHDTNMGSSADDTIRIGGIPFVIESDSGNYFSQTLDLRHEYRFFLEAPHTWNSDLLIYNSDYDKHIGSGSSEESAAVQYMKFRSGPTFNFSRWSTDLKATAGYVTSGHDDYMKTFGLENGYSYTLLENLWLNASLSFDKHTYFDNKARDAQQYRFSLSPTLLSGKNIYSVSLSVTDNHAKSALESYISTELSAYYLRQLPWQMNASVGYTYAFNKYDTSHPLFNAVQEDRINRVSFALTKQLSQGLILELKNTYTDRNSTLDIKEYERNLTSISLIYNF